MAKKKLTLRGAEIRTVQQVVSSGVCIIIAEVSCDITEALASEMGWEIYQGGHLIEGLDGTTGLTGKLYLEGIELQVQGGTGLQCPATTADTFKLTRAKNGNGIETSVRFRLLSSAWQDFTQFFGLMGSAEGRLVLKCQPEQTRIGDDAEETEAEMEAAAEPPSARRGRPRKQAEEATATTN